MASSIVVMFDHNTELRDDGKLLYGSNDLIKELLAKYGVSDEHV